MVGTRVFVGNLPSDTSERDLERFFRGYGRMREVLLKNGYGFVEFDDYRDAEDAVYELNGKKLLGIRITVERARGTPRGRDQFYARDRDYGGGRGDYRPRTDRYGPPTRTAYRLIVENLSSRVSWQDLKDYMRQAGEVTYADAHKKRRNEGVVEFASSSDMRNALDKLDNTEINGRRIKLIEDKRHSSRSSSYSSRSRSRSPRKSRSTSRSRSPVKKSKSRSVSRKKSVERSRSNSRVKSRESRSRSKDRSTSRRPKSEERSRSRSLKRESRSRSPKRESRSRSPKRESRSPSRNRSHSKSRSRSRSHDN